MARRPRVTVLAVVAALLLCSLVAPAAGAPAPASSTAADGDDSFGTIETQEFDADRTLFEIRVYENGSATWTFRYDQRLETDEDVQNFEAFAEEFNAQETELYTNFQRRAVALTDSGNNDTDREMSVRAGSFERSAEVRDRGVAGTEEFGVVEMSFVWSGFARLEGEQVVVGDIFVGGLYIADDQRIRFARGSGLAIEEVDPTPDSISGGTLADSETVTWAGEREFADRRPRAVFTDPSAVTAGTTAATETATPAATDSGWLLPLGAFVVVVLAGLGAGVAYRSGALPTDGAAATEPAGPEAASEQPPPTAGAGADADVETETQPPAVPDEELISDEERVVNLLENNGGRMKQVDIVDETEWSKSKVSMLLSDMEDEETISKLRVGRENIISLAGEEPDAAGSPFDDE
jgi:hypothetical protein